MTQAPPNTPKETDCEVREFQLYKTASDDETIWSAVEDTGEFENMIHVISFSAFEKLREENEAIRALCKELVDIFWLADMAQTRRISKNERLKIARVLAQAKEALNGK